MTSRVEQARLLHEDLEQNTRKCVEDLLAAATTTKDIVAKESRIAQRCEAQLQTGKKLLEIYADADNSRKSELDSISGEDVFEVFYDRLRDLRNYHRQNPQIGEAQVKASGSSHDVKAKMVFSGEEHFGRFLDISQFHARYVNMAIFRKGDSKEKKSIYDRSERQISYPEYLSCFDQFAAVPKDKKTKGLVGNQYKEYLTDLSVYIVGYYQRVEPLVATDSINSMILEDVQDRWSRKQVAGWFDVTEEGVDSRRKEKEKERELESNPLYCGACAKLFAKTSVYSAHLEGQKHKKAVAKQAKGESTTENEQPSTIGFDCALLEETIAQYAELLRTRINDTLVYLQNKRTRTLEEMNADLVEEEKELQLSTESEEEAVISNPLNLPMGWDGKPIPYWLYKLHGLNIEYKCEICGNFTYRGPRAFRRHFREWRHAYGMRCLGIPNTDHFHNITTFKDAIALHKKLMVNLKNSDFKPEEDEEFEDGEGHVFNKKTYDDLRRQGIL